MLGASLLTAHDNPRASALAGSRFRSLLRWNVVVDRIFAGGPADAVTLSGPRGSAHERGRSMPE